MGVSLCWGRVGKIYFTIWNKGCIFARYKVRYAQCVIQNKVF